MSIHKKSTPTSDGKTATLSSPRHCKLDVDAVRRRAQSIAGCKEIPVSSGPPQKPGQQQFVISFLVGLHESPLSTTTTSTSTSTTPTTTTTATTGAGVDATRNVNKLARINVFADTGTVSTCRVLQGKVRQTFRRNITSLDVVERLLRNPTGLTAIDEGLVGFTDTTSSYHNPTASSEDIDLSSTTSSKRQQDLATQLSLKAELELADVGLAILESEKEKLEQHFHDLEEQSREQNEETEHSTSSAREAPGEESSHTAHTEFQFSLPPDAMKHVDQCLHDIQSMGKLVRSISTNGKGTVFLYGNGGVAYTPCIPRALHHKLSQLRNSPYAARPSYVSLGSRDRYFCCFYDGTFGYKGPKGLDRELKKLTIPPLSVAFGSSWDTFFIVFQDGSWKCQGREVPADLEEKLEARGNRPDLVCVNLGPAGEWFLKARNGRIWWGGISDELHAAVQELLAAGNFLRWIDFGEDGSYVVTYD